MHVTWTTIELDEPSQEPPWLPDGASLAQAGQAAPGHAAVPDFAGRWWSVLGVWDTPTGEDPPTVTPPTVGMTAWHVVLEPVSYRGDAVLSGGARPFEPLPARGKVSGAAAVITLAGFGDDQARTAEFFERFGPLGEDVAGADGHRAALIQAPSDGAVLTFSAWRTLRDAVTWAYHRPEHAATVERQHEHRLLPTTGFLRCAVLASSGTLQGRDPLAGLTGIPVPAAP